MMTEPHLLTSARSALRELTRLAEERARTEQAVASDYAAATAAARQAHDETNQRTTTRYEAERAAADQGYQKARQDLPAQAQAEYDATEKEFFDARRKVSAEYAGARDKAREEYQEARWTIRTVYEAGKKEAQAQVKMLQESNGQLAKAKRRLARCQRLGVEHLEECRQSAVAEREEPPPSGKPRADDPFADLQTCVVAAKAALGEVRGQRLPRWFVGIRLFWVFLLLAVLAAAPAAVLERERPLPVAGIAAGAALGLTGVVSLVLYFVARSGLRRAYGPLCEATADGAAARKRCHAWVRATQKRIQSQVAMLRQRRNQDLQDAQRKAQRRLAALNRHRAKEAGRVEKHYPPLLATIRRRRDAALRDAEAEYQRAVTDSEGRYTRDMEEADALYARQTADQRAEHDLRWGELAGRWRQGLRDVLGTVDDVTTRCATLFPDWHGPAWADWQPATAVPPGLRFGEVCVRLAEVPHGVPEDERLRDGVPVALTLPALLPFPNRASVLLKAGESGRAAAVRVLQTMMLRFLTSLPPGKLRFTILDPVGLGENFAAFMHLADYDEALVASRIWTEQHHIEQRLADLTAHMENVIQKYLRNQFQTIEEYNAHAGEVAEAFRVLVVANFPANFSVEAARRLVSISGSGARCGVYTLVSVDPKAAMPQGFNLKDLEGPGVILVWKEGHFIWKDPDFEKYPLTLDTPPDDALITAALNVVGDAARGVKRVEVPFEHVAPAPADYWTKDSRKGIDVPLGRAGATRLQHLKLGQGTAQHVLIAGKTGSGKSTLLHALITNLALLYGPEEVELYLVDFKKGVEFKTYAAAELPHARVVAIESEREFGLSVLQRLDAELKGRGDRFRDAGVQDIAGYRQVNGSETCPRILLIVDEFQEFFVEDDKVAQEAALLLDRLVRQGRAFGIHIHLGSQTLSGAYTLARSTIDQMAVRIALQCSETDAYLILSKDNAAARLLSRPGEAIYNDANGLVEGNDIFQIVWLSDDQRDDYLRRVRELARQRGYVPPRPTIVFEGNVPADLAKNALLHALVEAPAWPEAVRAPRAWLGEAIAIKDPTAATFPAQSGSNVLILGQQEEMALGVVTGALLSLAAQFAAARFVLLDGTPVDSPHVAALEKVCDAVPQSVLVGGWRDVAVVVGEVAAEVERRQKAPQEPHAPWYFFIYGLPRFRDLRRSEDDFSFGRRGEARAASPSQQFGTILREGAALGVHVLLWCDSLNNLNRSFDRPALREFEMRVLFQMSAADSSTLIDNPAASKLGVNRALFHSEDRGQPEKFRPYGLPSEEWLAWLKERLRGRAALAGSGDGNIRPQTPTPAEP
ncbi:MAG TPA: FtsK/SpoIIIE domain-containing protein [Gemmataceae bacterium]|nr:FtsK/SpoIIIE domain-containing protein [Gemmataceae bacterium]